MGSSDLTQRDLGGGLMDAILAALRAGVTPDAVRLAAEFGEPLEEVEQFIRVVQLVGECADRSDAGIALDARVRVSPERPQLGDFRIVREIGRGGMGVVYEAEQLSLKRRVALKVLLPGVEVSEHALARFRREAHAAGGLHHKHIVPVFAVGHDEGVPYFAMQYVAGRPLSQILRGWRGQADRPGDAHFRTVATWGAKIAEALAHAHRSRVIHRDIKPSNIILDEGGEVWVTDFGLARYESSATLTLSGDIVGTLRYMSPEQARGSDLDERTDVYSLGVTLYELATLTTPFEGPDRESTLRKVLFDQPRRVRQVNPAVPRDLQTIIEHAMTRAPQQRYPSAALLAEDLRRFLRGERLLAEPPTVLQQTGRLIDRYKGRFALGGALLLLLLAFSVWMTVLYNRAAHVYELAESGRVAALAASRQEQEATARAEASAQRADQVRTFLEQMLTSIDPETARGRDTSLLRDLLRTVEGRIQQDLDGQPVAQARLHETIGRTYQSIWEPERADEHLTAAVALWRSLPANPPALAQALGRLAALRAEQGRYGLAAALQQEALDLVNDDPHAAQRGHLLTGLGAIQYAEDRYDEAGATLTEALETLTGVLQRKHRWVAACLHDLGLLARKQARAADAEAFLSEAHAIRTAVLGDDHPQTVASLASLAAVHYDSADFPAAVELYRQVLEARTGLYDADHPLIGETLSDLSIALHRAGRTAEGYPLARRALDIRRAALGAEHPDLVVALINLAGFARVSDQPAEAELLLREAIGLGERVLEQPHHLVAAGKRHLADVLQQTHRFEEAEPLLRAVLADREALFGPRHPQTASALRGMAAVLGDLQRHEEAVTFARRALTILRETLPAGHPDIIAALVGVGTAEMNRGALPAAEDTLLEALELQERTLDADDWRIAETESRYAETLSKQGRFDEAEPLLRSAITRLATRFGPQSNRAELAIYRLLHLYRAADRPEDAAWALPLAREGLAAREAESPRDPRAIGLSFELLGQIELMLANLPEAEAHLRDALAALGEALGDGHAEVAGVRSALGECLTLRGVYDEAEDLLQRATADLTRHYGSGHVTTQRAYRRLADLYDATGRADAAEPLRAMLGETLQD